MAADGKMMAVPVKAVAGTKPSLEAGTRVALYKQNARKIPQRAIDKVALSLKEFGWQQPIVIDKKGVIVVEHTRWLAAQQLGWTEAPVDVGRQPDCGAKAFCL